MTYISVSHGAGQVVSHLFRFTVLYDPHPVKAGASQSEVIFFCQTLLLFAIKWILLYLISVPPFLNKRHQEVHGSHVNKPDFGEFDITLLASWII